MIPRKPVIVLGMIVSGLLLPIALATQQVPNPLESAGGAVGALYPLRVLVPLGINPFLALGLIGLGSFHFGMPLPSGLSFLAYPAAWAVLLVLAITLQVGRSFKITKPLVEVIGTTESLIGILALVAMFFTDGAAVVFSATSQVYSASVFGTTLMAIASVLALFVVILVRMGFDLLTWISPFPFVDGLLQSAKFLLTVVLITTAIFAPFLAIGANIALLGGTVFALRWLIRLGRFALTIALARLVAIVVPARIVIDEKEIGPIIAFHIRGETDLPPLEQIHLHWNSEGW